MARTIMTLDKSHIDLIVNGNAFGLTINQIDGDTIKVSGMLENGATFIIDGIDTISTVKAPKEQLPEAKAVEIPVIEKPVTQIELPMQVETKPVIQKPKETTSNNVNMTKHRSTRCIMKEKSKEIMDDLAFGLATQASIAEKYGVSLGTINRFYNNNKEEIEKMRLNKADENLDAILEDLAKGMQVPVVSNKYGIPQSTIHEVYADNLDKVKNIKISIMNANTKSHVPEPKKVNYVPDPTPTAVVKRSSEETFDTKETTYYPGKINESFSIDSDTEATIISQLIDDIPIVKIAKDFNIPRERVQKVYFDNKDYICMSRESRIRRPKSSMTNNAAASKDSLENLIKSFATR